MGTIVARKRKSGSTGYLAQIILKRDGRVAHQESQVFDRRQAAAAWMERREAELRKPGSCSATLTGRPATRSSAK
jgi:hypothetical protein